MKAVYEKGIENCSKIKIVWKKRLW